MKTVIISGASRGIGKATAEKFLKEGWKVIGISANGNSSIPHKNFEIHKADLSNSINIKQFIGYIQNLKIEVDVLINNAAISIDSSSKLSIEALRKTLEVNLIGTIDLTEQLIPFINANGHIINLSSGLGSLTYATSESYPSYRITKVAINMYTRTLAARLAPKQITVSSVDPGWVKTDMGGLSAPRNVIEPASEIFELATSKIESGFFWHQMKKIAW